MESFVCNRCVSLCVCLEENNYLNECEWCFSGHLKYVCVYSNNMKSINTHIATHHLPYITTTHYIHKIKIKTLLGILCGNKHSFYKMVYHRLNDINMRYSENAIISKWNEKCICLGWLLPFETFNSCFSISKGLINFNLYVCKF